MVIRKYTGDPFVDLPKHANAVSTERLERWAAKGECLCGCEIVTKNRHGLHSYFMVGHSTRVYNNFEHMPKDEFDRMRKRIVVTYRLNNVNCLIIGTLVKDYLEANKMSAAQLAREIGCSVTWLRLIINNKKGYIRRQSAVRLLKAIKEPVPLALLIRAPRSAAAIGRKGTPG